MIPGNRFVILTLRQAYVRFIKYICSYYVICSTVLPFGFVLLDTQVTAWINKYGWKEQANGDVFVSNQEESIKTKNITEKITFDSKWRVLNVTF